MCSHLGKLPWFSASVSCPKFYWQSYSTLIKRAPSTVVFYRPCKKSALFITSYFHTPVSWRESGLRSLSAPSCLWPLLHPWLLLCAIECTALCAAQSRDDHSEVSSSIYIRHRENTAERVGSSFLRNTFSIGSMDATTFLQVSSLISGVMYPILHSFMPTAFLLE